MEQKRRHSQRDPNERYLSLLRGLRPLSDRRVEPVPARGESEDDYSNDEIVSPAGSGIGMPGYLELMKAP